MKRPLPCPVDVEELNRRVSINVGVAGQFFMGLLFPRSQEPRIGEEPSLVILFVDASVGTLTTSAGVGVFTVWLLVEA